MLLLDYAYGVSVQVQGGLATAEKYTRQAVHRMRDPPDSFWLEPGYNIVCLLYRNDIAQASKYGRAGVAR